MAKKDTEIDIKKTEPAEPPTAKTEAWTPFSTLRSEIDRLFDEFDPASWHMPMPRWRSGTEPMVAWRSRWAVSPAMDLVEHADAYEIKAELPGIDKNDIEVKLTDAMLTIRGEKAEEHEEKEANYHLSERRFGAFQRSFRLPDGVDADKIEASCSDGVLRVKLPKSKEARQKERKVEIKAK